jgi:hypothetical protein
LKGDKMINVICHTNLDDYKTLKWPTQLSCRPQVGDYIESKCGKTLKIIRITHTQENIPKLRLKLELYKD